MQTEQIEREQALAAYPDLIRRYRTMLTVRSNSLDIREAEAVIGGLLELLDGPDWRALAEVRHRVFGLAVPDATALRVALQRLPR